MDKIESTFSLADYLVLAAVLLISSIIGLYYRYVTSPLYSLGRRSYVRFT